MSKDKEKIKKEEANLSELENALTKTEIVLQNHQKQITTVVAIIIVVVVGYIGFKKFYIQPKEKSAQSQMFMAEQYFEKDSFNLAINGDGNYLGFIDIIDKYGITKSAKLANYYAGISYLNLGNYQEAVNYLNKFSSEDLLLTPVCEGAKGDAYLEMNKNKKALSCYKKAISYKNDFTAPIYLMKAALVYESEGNNKKALEAYQEIKDNYPESTEGREIDKYISRLSAKQASK